MHLQAQDARAITANIRFPFTVGTQSIAPEIYQFSLMSSPFLLSVRNVKTGDEELFTVRPERQEHPEVHGSLTFRKSGDSDVLNEVHFPETRMFTHIIRGHGVPRTEAKRSSTCKATTVAQR